MPVSIDDQLGIGSEPRELIIGKSFRKLLASSSSGATSNSNFSKGKNGHHSNHGSPASPSTGDSFHTLRYDFKPASVDVSKMARMEFSQNNDKVKVTVPNVEASNLPETIFTGSKNPHLKECVLIIDHETGEVTLERLTHSINVKKTRVEGSSRSQQQLRPSTPSLSPAPSSSSQTTKPSKPSSPFKDSTPSNTTVINGHHLSVPGQMNGKSSSSSSAKAVVPVPSPLSQSNNSGSVPGHAKPSAHVREQSESSSDDDTGSDSSSSSDGSSSDGEDGLDYRKVEQVLCDPTSMNDSTAHKHDSSDSNSSDDDDSMNVDQRSFSENRDREQLVRAKEMTSSTASAHKSSQDTKRQPNQSSQWSASSSSNYSNTQQPQPTNTVKKQLNQDLCLSEESSDESGCDDH